MILRARSVVTMDGPPIDDGAVVVEGDSIVDVGRFEAIRRLHGGSVTDLGERVLLPGLINAHCHLDYTCLRGKIPRQNSFADWIKAINAAKAVLSPDDYINSIQDGFEEARRFGTTSMVNFSAFPNLIRSVEETVRTWWMAELIDVRDPSRAGQIVEDALQALRPLKRWGLAPHSPYTASAQLYRKCAEAASLLSTHLAESREEMMMSFDLGGPLADFLAPINPDLFLYDGRTPIEHVIENICSLDDRWLLVHLNELLDSDLDSLTRQSSKSYVVHCPRSHQYFGHSPFRYEALRLRGMKVCLGTDSLATNDDLSLFGEMRAFQAAFPNVEPSTILRMTTVDPADALRQGGRLGVLRRGACADIIAITVTGSRLDPLEHVLAFDGEPWVMIGGQIGTI